MKPDHGGPYSGSQEVWEVMEEGGGTIQYTLTAIATPGLLSLTQCGKMNDPI